MPCDTVRRKFNQTQEQRNEEISEVIARVTRGLAEGRITPVVGAQGGVYFQGLTDEDRAGVTDICVFRRLMVEGNASAMAAIQMAELVAGHTVDNRALEQGWHTHDGLNWGRH